MDGATDEPFKLSGHICHMKFGSPLIHIDKQINVALVVVIPSCHRAEYSNIASARFCRYAEYLGPPLAVLTISKRCYRVIMFNFWGTILVDTVGIGLAVFGLLAPVVVALIHVGSELAFILNSARLFRNR